MINYGKILGYNLGQFFGIIMELSSPEDIKAIAPDVLRHRVLTTYDADAQELTSDDIIKQIFDGVEVP